MTNKDLFAAEFKEVGDSIRHFSTTRSALTTFLLTVGVACFGAYFHQAQTSPFFIVAAALFLLASIGVCFRFSYLTERYLLYQKTLWTAALQPDFAQATPVGVAPAYPNNGLRGYHPTCPEVWLEMRRDKMNWVLVTLVSLLLLAFLVVILTKSQNGAKPAAGALIVVALLATTVALVWLHGRGVVFPLRFVLGLIWAGSLAVAITLLLI